RSTGPRPRAEFGSGSTMADGSAGTASPTPTDTPTSTPTPTATSTPSPTSTPTATPTTLDAYLHGIGPNANPPTLLLSGGAPPAATPKYRDSAGVQFAAGNAWKEIGTWAAAPEASARTLTALGDAHMWIGLKSSDDQGTAFDVRTEVYRNSVLVASGTTRC